MDKEEIEKVLLRNAMPEKEQWSRNIIRTNMPMYVVKTQVLKDIAKQVLKGDYLEYLNNETFEHYENTIIYAKVLSKVKDFETFRTLLYRYIPYVDNWASCDSLEFSFKPSEQSNYMNLAKALIVDLRIYARRIGVLILFEMLGSKDSTLQAFELIKKLKGEQEYYVNMCVAWFLCEAYIKQRDLADEFLRQDFINNFVLAKTVSKCRDSFRVSSEDKERLKQLKDSKLS